MTALQQCRFWRTDLWGFNLQEPCLRLSLSFAHFHKYSMAFVTLVPGATNVTEYDLWWHEPGLSGLWADDRLPTRLSRRKWFGHCHQQSMVHSSIINSITSLAILKSVNSSACGIPIDRCSCACSRCITMQCISLSVRALQAYDAVMNVSAARTDAPNIQTFNDLLCKLYCSQS